MKKQLLAAWAVAISLMGCASQNTFQTDPPFSISEPRAQTWAAGREEGGMGTTLSMRWNPYQPDAYTLDTLYFRGRSLSPVVEDTETGMRLTASYETLDWEREDMIMSSDSLQEVRNQPPMPLVLEPEPPFELEGDEAVLVYTRIADGKRFYYKITQIKEAPARILPSRPQN